MEAPPAAGGSDRMEQGLQAMMMVNNPRHTAAGAAAIHGNRLSVPVPSDIPSPYIVYPTAAAAAAATPGSSGPPKRNPIAAWMRPAMAGAVKSSTESAPPPRIGGVDVSNYSWFLRWRFLWVTLIVFLAEAILGAWPVVALSVWGWTSLFALVHFLWWFKALLLFPAVMRNMAAPWLLASEPVKHQGQMRSSSSSSSPPSLWRAFWNSAYTWDLTLWSMVSIFGHALASAIVLILTLVTRSVMSSTLQWILLIVFGAVAIIESLVSPWFVMGWAIDRPALQAREASLMLLTPVVVAAAATTTTAETLAVSTTAGVPWSTKGAATTTTTFRTQGVGGKLPSHRSRYGGGGGGSNNNRKKKETKKSRRPRRSSSKSKRHRQRQQKRIFERRGGGHHDGDDRDKF